MYDSATDTALAGQAWAAATKAVSDRRTQLNRGFGMNADGSMDNSDLGHLGSLYQGNLGSVMQDQQAETADRRRGFGSSGGLGHKHTAATEKLGLDKQALSFRDATTQLDQNTADQNAADQQHTNDITNIASRQAAAERQALIDNPISTTPNAPPGGNAPLTNFGISPARALAQKKALAKNPRAAQTAKNRF